MHYALKIDEILRLIFDFCAPPESHWTTDRGTYTTDLAVLARTCRAFKEIALDVLWSQLVNLTPLARCLPEDCRSFSRGTWSFRRPPGLKKEEWDILLGYTRRVRKIGGITPNLHEWLDKDSLIATCNAASPAQPLFPNLRECFWHGRPLIPAVHVAASSLTKLTLYLTYLENQPALIDFLTCIGDSCPNLTQVLLHIFQSDTLHERICHQIYRWKNLQELDFQGLTATPQMVSELSHLGLLKTLRLALVPGVIDWVPAFGLLSTFLRLRHLVITCASLPPITGFLSCMKLPALEELHVTFPQRPSRGVFRAYVSTVHNVCRPDQLTKFACFNAPCSQFPVAGPTNDSGNWQLTLDDLHPLIDFVELREVQLVLRWSLGLTGEDVLTLDSVWPRKELVCINNYYWGVWRAGSR